MNNNKFHFKARQTGWVLVVLLLFFTVGCKKETLRDRLAGTWNFDYFTYAQEDSPSDVFATYSANAQLIFSSGDNTGVSRVEDSVSGEFVENPFYYWLSKDGKYISFTGGIMVPGLFNYPNEIVHLDGQTLHLRSNYQSGVVQNFYFTKQ